MQDLSKLLVRLSDFNGNWDMFINEIYGYFVRDFVTECPEIGNCEVIFRPLTIEDGKYEYFWHLVTKEDEPRNRSQQKRDRYPDFERAARIRWIRPILENYDDQSITIWRIYVDKKSKYYFRYMDEFIVEIGRIEGFRNFFMITSFFIETKHKKRFQSDYEKYRIEKKDVALATSWPFKP